MTKTKRKDVPKPSPTPKTEPTAPPVLGVVPKGELKEIQISDIHDPPGEPDRLARPDDADQIAEVARSLREVGQLQPVMVEANGHVNQAKPYLRVFGRRRIAAAKLNGAKTILAIVVGTLAPDARRTIVAVENIQRKDLTAAEEHLAVAELLDLQAIEAALQVKAPLFGVSGWAGRGHTMTTDIAAEMRASLEHSDVLRRDLLRNPNVRTRACEIVAAMLAKTPTWVRDRMYIGRLGVKGRALVLAGKLPILHAREIAKVADAEIREDLAVRFAAGGASSISDTEPGQFEELAGEVSNRLFTLAVVPWKLDVAVGTCPPCEGCPSNSQTNPGLFEHGGGVSKKMRGGVGMGFANVTAAGVCTDHSCYARKLSVAKGLLTNVAKKVVDQKGHPTDVRNAVAVLQTKAINAKVEARRQLKTSSRGVLQRGTAKPSAADVLRESRRQAEEKWRQAMRARSDKIEPLIAAALAKKPGAWSVFMIFTETKLFQATRGGDSKAARTAESPAMLSLLKNLSTPCWESILTMEKDCGTRCGLLSGWYDGPSVMADKIAAALGVQIGPIPTVDDFMPKGSQPAKEGKKPKATPIPQDEHLEEESE